MTTPCRIIGGMRGERVLGVDACRAGWLGIALAGDQVSAYVAAAVGSVVELAEADGAVEVVAIDIPIGLPDRSRRQADVLARRAIGPLWPSVFITPVRTALNAPSHPAATAENRALTGEGVSIQAFRLKPKLLQVDHLVRRTHRRVVEVHPEVCFAQMAGSALTVGKHTWAGAELRRRLLADAGIPLPGDFGTPGRQAAVDDVLDATAAAWTARRVAEDRAQARPDPPEVFSDGLPCAIWA
jgi:predicted RNase H-like nuclease